MNTRTWPEPRLTRIPAWIYSDPEVYQRELALFHYGRSWNLVGLECELAEPETYKRSFVGERSVIVARDRHGEIHVMENRCAHRGAPVALRDEGQAKSFTCPYHNWTFDLTGNLVGVPFRRGLRGQGGYLETFELSAHGLRKLRVALRGGAIWATFDENAPDFETFVGPDVISAMDRTATRGPMKFLGATRQFIDCNWKLWIDNSRDTYHATLLHTFLTQFNLVRADLPIASMNIHGPHTQNTAYLKPLERAAGDTAQAKQQIRVTQTGHQLADFETVDPDFDEFGDGQNVGYQVFPSAMFRQHLSAPSFRQIMPRGPHRTEVVWSFYGYADDTPHLRRRRLKQANLVGAGGYVTAEDGEMVSLLQPVMSSEPAAEHVLELGGDSLDNPSGLLFENTTRQLYKCYREVMGF